MPSCGVIPVEQWTGWWWEICHKASFCRSMYSFVRQTHVSFPCASVCRSRLRLHDNYIPSDHNTYYFLPDRCGPCVGAVGVCDRNRYFSFNNHVRSFLRVSLVTLMWMPSCKQYLLYAEHFLSQHALILALFLTTSMRSRRYVTWTVASIDSSKVTLTIMYSVKTQANKAERGESDMPSVPTEALIECGVCQLKRPRSALHCYDCGLCVDEVRVLMSSFLSFADTFLLIFVSFSYCLYL